MLRKVDVILCPQINNLSIISEVYECNQQQLSYKLIFNIGVVNIVEMGVSWKQGL